MSSPRQELIRQRLAAGFSQRDMAREIGISRNALVNAEDGDPVRIFTARKMAEFYGRSIPELFPDLLELEGAA
jgi:DNA-binding XRE family transcriptional regulator